MSHARRAIRARTRPKPRRRERVRTAPTWKPGRGQTIRCLAFALGVLITRSAGAQPRELKTYGSGAPEAKLMLYYSSTVAFSPLGAPFVHDPQPLVSGGVVEGRSTVIAVGVIGQPRQRRVEAAIELSYLPHLSLEQRTTGSDKPEATNLAPVFARPRVAIRLPAGFGVEASWIPPVRVFDVKANLFGGAISRSFALPSRVRLVPRASFVGGRVEGPITCNRESMTAGGAALATYFSRICYSSNSRDYFEPRHVSGELLFTRPAMSGRWQPYVSAGARAERTRFDIGVMKQGMRDQDQPVLEVKTTRAFGTAGTSWLGIPRTRLAAELYYAPGSAVTVRGLAGLRLW